MQKGERNMANDIIFAPLKFRNLTVKNRIFRSRAERQKSAISLGN